MCRADILNLILNSVTVNKLRLIEYFPYRTRKYIWIQNIVENSLARENLSRRTLLEPFAPR